MSDDYGVCCNCCQEDKIQRHLQRLDEAADYITLGSIIGYYSNNPDTLPSCTD